MILNKIELISIYNSYSNIDFDNLEFSVNTITSNDELFKEYIEIFKKYNNFTQKELIRFFSYCYTTNINKMIADNILKFNPRWLSIDKNDSEWFSIPFLEPTFIYPDLYENHKKNGVALEFEKYCKIIGLATVSDKDKIKYVSYKRIADSKICFTTNTIAIRKEILDCFIDAFRSVVLAAKLADPTKICWPFATHIVSDPDVRQDKSYPLMTTQDYLRIDYVGSFIYAPSKRKAYFDRMARSFMTKTCDDIKLWLKNICNENKEYQAKIDYVYKLKKKRNDS